MSDQSPDRRVTWFDHAGRQILFADYRGLTTADEAIRVLEGELAVLRSTPGGVLVLADFTGASATPEYISRLHEVAKESRNALVAKTAVLGITGLKAILFDSYVKFTGDAHVRQFDDRASALGWLAE